MDPIPPNSAPVTPDPDGAARRLPELGINRPVIHETLLGGVPAFWTPIEGPLKAVLAFRVGRRDETLPTSGITHLVEHLALTGFASADHPFNGTVDERETRFMAAGRPGEVAEFLQRTVAHLANLPVDRLPAERRILMTEASQRRPSASDALLQARFGATGIGLIGREEFALRRTDADELRCWATTRFTRASAALLLTGEPPVDRLDLPEGEVFPCPAAVDLPNPTPFVLTRPANVIAVGMVLPRAELAGLVPGVVARRALDRLRMQLGIAYSVNAQWTAVDDARNHLTIITDCADGAATQVFDELRTLLTTLGVEGPNDQELERELDRYARGIGMPEATAATLDLRLRYHLHGGSPPDLVARFNQISAVTAQQVAAALGPALENAYWLVPQGTRLPEGFQDERTYWPHVPLTGRVITPRRGSAPGLKEIALTAGGLSAVGSGQVVTVPFGECAAVLSWTTGQRALIRNDGYSLTLDPLDFSYVDAAAITDAIDSLPAALVVPMGPRTRPTPRPATSSRRRQIRQLFRLGALVAWVTAIGVMTVTSIGGTRDQSTAPTPTFGFVPNPAGPGLLVPTPAPASASTTTGGSVNGGLLALAIVMMAATVVLGALLVRSELRRRHEARVNPDR